jgi:hypothetical protein
MTVDRDPLVILAPPPGYMGESAAQEWVTSPLMSILVHTLEDEWGLGVMIEGRRDPRSLPVNRTSLLAFNRQASSLGKWKSIPRDRRILTIWEPPSVAPQLFTRRNLTWFGRRIALSREWAIRAHARFSPWPQPALSGSTLWPAMRERKAVIVASRKRSSSAGSLYGLRRRVIDQGTRAGVLDLYGRGWDSTKNEVVSAAKSLLSTLKAGRVPDLGATVGGPWRPPGAWGGTVASSTSTMSAYEVAVVIENDPTYVSEKLFDALAAGCIPVYVGAPLGDYDIPQDVVISVRPSAEDVLRTCADVLAGDLRGRRSAIREYLSSAGCEPWKPPAAMRTFADACLSPVTEDGSRFP